MNDVFTPQRILAAVLILICACIGWYVLVLMTNPTGDWSARGMQWRGLCLVVVMAVLGWINRCYSIRLNK